MAGTVTARFRLEGNGRLLTGVKAGGKSTFYGFSLLNNANGAYHVTVVAPAVGPTLAVSYNLESAYPQGLALPPGTYDLTLFSRSPARVAVTIYGRLSGVRWSARPLHAVFFGERTTSPFWEKTLPFRTSAAPRALVVYFRDEWTGAAASSEVVCLRAETPCAVPDVQQLTDATPTVPGDRVVLYAAAFGGVRRRQYDVVVQSVVAGVGVQRIGVVVPVP